MPTSRRQFLAGSLATLGASLDPSGPFATVPPEKSLAAWDAPARALVAQLTRDEKVGRMTQPDQMYLEDLDDLEKYHVGSLLSGGDSDPKSVNDLESWTNLYDRYQSRALQAKPRLPLLYGIDAVHGHNNLLGSTILSYNIGFVCTRRAELVDQASRVIAQEVLASGLNWA